MTAPTSYNPLLIFLFSGTLIISGALLSNGEAVVDTNGDKIHTGSIHDVTYRIRPGPGIGFRGGLGRSPIKGDKCQKYIYEGPETFPGEPIQFDTDFDSGSDVMEVGLRYRFTFLSSQQKTCKKPGVWTIGNVVNEGQTSFQPIIAGQKSSSNLDNSWIEVRSTEQKGVYKLAACPCELCRIMCPEIGSFTTDDGRTVLGIGGEHYTVQFTTDVIAMKGIDEE